MMAEQSQERKFEKHAHRALVVTSGAANTCAIEDTHIPYLYHGGMEAEALEQDEQDKLILCLGGYGGRSDISQAEWSRCWWRDNKVGRMLPPMLLLAWLSPHDSFFESAIALSRSSVEEYSKGIGVVSEAATYSASDYDPAPDFERREWRGTFSVSYPEKIIFSQVVELKTAELPRWKPHVTLDLHRLERVNE